jgi:hypothetical protein
MHSPSYCLSSSEESTPDLDLLGTPDFVRERETAFFEN